MRMCYNSRVSPRRFLYVLTDPNAWVKTCYVGCTHDFEARKIAYMDYNQTHSAALEKWFYSLRLWGMKPTMTLICSFHVNDAKEIEQAFIESYRAKFNKHLLNNRNSGYYFRRRPRKKARKIDPVRYYRHLRIGDRSMPAGRVLCSLGS